MWYYIIRDKRSKCMGNLEENLKETNNNQVQLLEKEKTEEKERIKNGQVGE